MRKLSLLPLDDDVIDRVLTFLPDFPSLGAAILTSKHFYTIFKTHPHSIIRAVAYNITGPALPQAMRVLRYTRIEHPKPWSESDSVSPITNEEAKNLVKNAAVVKALEDLFSSRHKDRTSQVSKLSSMESSRFRCAIYRIMLFSRAFPGYDLGHCDEETAEEEIREARHRRKKFLLQFPNYELLPVHSVAAFLTEVALWVEVTDSSYLHDGFGDMALSFGPADILQAYQNQTTDDIRSEVDVTHEDIDELPEIMRDYLAHPLSKIWEERKTKPPPSDASHWKSILDDIHGEHDICHRCSAVHGFNLWNETSWDYLAGIKHMNTIPQLVKGNLSQNSVEFPSLCQTMYSSPFTYTSLLTEIHAIRTDTYNNWDKQDWLCFDCITEIIRSHLHLWFLEEKKKTGETIKDDCWYGYNCRTQTHKYYHASRLNHLCEPTR